MPSLRAKGNSTPSSKPSLPTIHQKITITSKKTKTSNYFLPPPHSPKEQQPHLPPKNKVKPKTPKPSTDAQNPASHFFKRTSSIRTLFTASICTTSSSGGSSSSAASKIRKEDISAPMRDPPTCPARPTKRTDEVIAALMRDGTARTVLPGSAASRAVVVGGEEKKKKGKGKAKEVGMRKRSDALVEGDYRGPRFEAGEAERLLVVGKRRDGRGRAKAMRVRRQKKKDEEEEEERGACGRGTEWREELRVDGDGSIGRAGGVMWRSQEGMRMWVSDV